MRINPSTLLITCLCFFSISIVQGKPLPGYYVNKKGDTVQCLINFNDHNISPTSIEVFTENKKLDFSPADINGFGVTGYSEYRAATVTYHLNPISGTSIPSNYLEDTLTKHLFLKILETGYYTLYELILPDRLYYFISENNGSPKELVYRVEQTEGEIQEDEAYKKTLFALLIQEGVTDGGIKSLNITVYGKSSIRKLIISLNQRHSGIARKPVSKSGNFQVELFAGASMFFFPGEFYGQYALSKLDPAYSGSGGVNILHLIPGKFNRFKVGFSAGYMHFNATSQDSGSYEAKRSTHNDYIIRYNERLSSSGSMIQTNLYLLYVLNPLAATNVYLKAGLSYNWVVGKSIVVNTDYNGSKTGANNLVVPHYDTAFGTSQLLVAQHSYPDLLVGVGLIHGKSKLEVGFNPGKQIFAYNSSYLNNSFKSGALTLYYYYRIFNSSRRVRRSEFNLK